MSVPFPVAPRLAAVLILLGLVAASAAALARDTRFVYLLVYVWFGVGYGLLLQYGRFCMAAAVRDLFAVRVPRMAVGMMIAVVLYALVAAAVTAAGHSTFHPHALGWHVLLGGAVFGIGMVFTGGCASGSLYKAGEGNLAAVLVIVSISLSQALVVSIETPFDSALPAAWVASAAAKNMPESLSATRGAFDIFTAGHLWDLKGGTLADRLGVGAPGAALALNTLLNGVLPALALLVLLYVFFHRRRHLRQRGIAKPGWGDELRGLWSLCAASKNTALAGIGLGVLAGLHMWATASLREHYGIFNFGELLAAMGHSGGLSIDGSVFDPGYWYITTQEAQWAGWALDLAGVPMMDNLFFGAENGIPNPLLNAPGFMSLGIVLGAAVLALLRHEFKWKWPDLEGALFAIAGGAVMGLGARLAMGCNIGAFFATVTNGDPSGWLFLLGMSGGGYLGVKAYTAWLDWKLARSGVDPF